MCFSWKLPFCLKSGNAQLAAEETDAGECNPSLWADQQQCCEGVQGGLWPLEP